MADEEYFTVRGYQLFSQNDTLKLSASEEDYMEMICRRMRDDGHIRVNTLADWLHVKPSSASKMLIRLKQIGLVVYERYGTVTVTKRGWEIGTYLLWRHDVVISFFTALCTGEEKELFREAELVEHDLLPITAEYLKAVTDYLRLHAADYQEFLKERNKQKNPPGDGAGGSQDTASEVSSGSVTI